VADVHRAQVVAHRYTRRWVKQARELGFECEAAQIPQRGRKTDWNDLHQRWMFLDEDKRAEQVAADLKEARHQGALLIAETAAEKALLMYEWRKRHEFHFGFGNRMYWFKLDMEKFNKAMLALESSENHDDKLLNDRQMTEKALSESGGVVEIANCYPQALYFQRNEITDESWYYFRVDFPHDEPTVRNTFTGGQVAAASEFKKRLLGMAAGAVFTGTGAQLDKIMKDQLFGLKTVKTIDYIGFSKEHGCYVFGDLAVRGGVVEQANSEDYFEFKQLRLKTLQKSIRLEIARTDEGYRAEWLDWLWTCFSTQGIVALAYWFGSLFAEQIREEYQSFPFLEVTGEAGAGKSTLLMFLWKLFGRPDEEGKDPSKMSKAGLRRWMGQVSGMPLVLLEADRSDNDRGAAKAYDWDELKPLFNGGTLGVTGVKTAGNETYEPPFRGAIVISQNATVAASEAILTRIVKLHFVRPQVTTASRAAADNLTRLVVQRPDQTWQLATGLGAGLGQCLERFRRERIAAHGRHGVDVVVQQCDGVENALDNPQLTDLKQVQTRRAPPVAAHALPRGKARLLLAETMRTINQPFPVAALLQRETDRGRTDAQLAAPVVLLGVPAFDQLQAKAACGLQVALGGGGRLLLGGWGALAPVIEQVVEQFLDVPLLRPGPVNSGALGADCCSALPGRFHLVQHDHRVDLHVPRGHVTAVCGQQQLALGLVDLAVGQRLGQQLVHGAAQYGGANRALIELHVVQVDRVGIRYEHAAVHCSDILWKMAGTGLLLEQVHLLVAQRAAAGALVEMVVELLQVQPQARGGALAAARVGAHHGTHHLAAGF